MKYITEHRALTTLALSLCILFNTTAYAADEAEQIKQITPITELKSYSNTKAFQLFGEALSTEAIKAPTGKAKVIIYRAQAPKTTLVEPQSLFINGDYQASLLPEGYTAQNICPGNSRITVALGKVDHAKPQLLSELSAKANQTYFFEILQSANGDMQLQPRTLSDLASAGKLQMQTISRYRATACEAPPEKIVLDANGFFAFDKYGIDDLQQEGRVRLASLMKYMKTDFASIEAIKIDGYTDRFGGIAYNERLSKARADTVSTYFAKHGINAKITTHGWGPANPIVNCPGERTKAVTDCLYPNRRFEVTINGIKKKTDAP